MISGRVTADREAIIPLEILGSDLQHRHLDVILDTGFNGALTLPSPIVRDLELPFLSTRRATLADGSTVALEMYLAVVVWHEQEREVPVLQAEGDVLIGMALIEGSHVTLDVIEGGDVIIEPLG